MKIDQHELTDTEQDQIDALLKALDTRISSLQFAVGGLITDRSNPEPVDCNIGFRNIRFMRWNGCQTIEFSFGEANSQNIELEQTIKEIMNFIIELCKTPMSKSYRERYDNNLKDIYDYYDKINFWDMRPPQSAK